MYDVEAEYYYFNRGIYKKIKIQQPENYYNILMELIRGTDEILKLLVSEERIDKIKHDESGIEIIFNESIRIHSQNLGIFKINKLLIPFEGYYVGNEKDPMSTIFIGDNGYMSGPLRNSKGFEHVKKIELLLMAELKKKK